MSFLKSNGFKILITVLSIVLVAVLGSVFVNLGMDWFNLLNRPSQWIPNVVIPIVWTIIYIVFGVVLSLWIFNSTIPRAVVVWLIINGVLNVLWCLVFFTLELTFVGNIVIILNLISAVVLFLQIYNEKRWYAIATVIYPIWLCLATSLNLALWILN